MSEAPRDQNSIPAILGTSNADGSTPVTIYADPTTHRLLADTSVTLSSVAISGGTVTVGQGTVNINPSAPFSIQGTVTANLGASSNVLGTVYVTPNAGVNLNTSAVTVSTALPSGSNTLGTVSVNSLPNVVVSTLPALVAGNATIGTATVNGTVSVNSLPALTAGSNTIGTATVNGTVSVNSLPALAAGGNRIGTVNITGVPTPTSFVYGTTTISTNISTDVIAAQGSGVKTYITSAVLSNTGTTSVNVNLVSGVTRHILLAPCGTAGIGMGGAAMNFAPYGIPGLANTAWSIVPSATTTISISLTGYTSLI